MLTDQDRATLRDMQAVVDAIGRDFAEGKARLCTVLEAQERVSAFLKEKGFRIVSEDMGEPC